MFGLVIGRACGHPAAAASLGWLYVFLVALMTQLTFALVEKGNKL